MNRQAPLLEVVSELVDEALSSSTSPQTIDALKRAKARLAEPLRVAVAGRVSSGKSTLVNALLGQPVAPTAAGECTKVVTWFRSTNDADRAEVVLEDGTTRPLALDEHRSLPDDIGYDVAAVKQINVWLFNAKLRRLTII